MFAFLASCISKFPAIWVVSIRKLTKKSMPSIEFNAANFDNLDQQYLLEDPFSIESNLGGSESAWPTFGSEGDLPDTMPAFGNINYLG